MLSYFLTQEQSIALVMALLTANGVCEADARVVADHLTQAEMRGLASHGLQRMTYYVPKLRAGGIKAKPETRVLADRGAAVQYDADSALGMVAGTRAMRLCIERARQYGIACVNVTHANHYGFLAYYAEMALRENMIAVCMCTSKANTAPYGANERAFGSNPLCMAVPANERPVVYDGATSIVAQGKLTVADLENHEIPDTWAFDREGQPTTNPSAAIQGALRTMGGYKGSGISMLISLICGGLGDVAFEYTEENARNTAEPARGQDLDQLFIAIDISAFTGVERFKQRVDAYGAAIKTLRPDKDAGGIFLPGEKEDARVAASRALGGFTISETLKDKLAALCEQSGVERVMDGWAEAR